MPFNKKGIRRTTMNKGRIRNLKQHGLDVKNGDTCWLLNPDEFIECLNVIEKLQKENEELKKTISLCSERAKKCKQYIQELQKENKYLKDIYDAAIQWEQCRCSIDMNKIVDSELIDKNLIHALFQYDRFTKGII